MLRGVKRKLVDFHVMSDGKPIVGKEDPYGWSGLNLSTDRGADMVAIDNFLSHIGIFVNTDYDPSHDAKNVGRGALKSSGLWSRQVLHPALTPPTYNISIQFDNSIRCDDTIRRCNSTIQFGDSIQFDDST